LQYSRRRVLEKLFHSEKNSLFVKTLLSLQHARRCVMKKAAAATASLKKLLLLPLRQQLCKHEHGL